jgi:hypothetical protein
MRVLNRKPLIATVELHDLKRPGLLPPAAAARAVDALVDAAR